VLALDLLGLGDAGVQAVGDVLGDAVAAHDNDGGEDVGAFAVDREVGGAAADVDEDDAELALVVVEDGGRAGERLEHDVDDVEAGAVAALDDVLDAGGGGGDDVGADLHADAAHADRVLDLALAVDHVLEREGVDDLAVERDVDRLGLLDHAGDVSLGDLAVAHADLAEAAKAADVAAGDAAEDRLDVDGGHLLGLLDRPAAMLLVVASMLTTTPWRSPSEGQVPTPMISRPFSVTSPMMAATLVVPISRPTMTSPTSAIRCSVHS
jgi:hypothetical protein